MTFRMVPFMSVTIFSKGYLMSSPSGVSLCQTFIRDLETFRPNESVLDEVESYFRDSGELESMRKFIEEERKKDPSSRIRWDLARKFPGDNERFDAIWRKIAFPNTFGHVEKFKLSHCSKIKMIHLFKIISALFIFAIVFLTLVQKTRSL